jgi:hypothetical protein
MRYLQYLRNLTWWKSQKSEEQFAMKQAKDVMCDWQGTKKADKFTYHIMAILMYLIQQVK